MGTTAAAAVAGAAAATGTINADAAAAAKQMKLDGGIAATNDLATLHAAALQAEHMSGQGRAEEYLGHRMSDFYGGLGCVGHMCIVMFVVGVAWLGYTRSLKSQLAKTKGHSRSE